MGTYDLNKQNPYEQEFRVTKVTLHKDYKHSLFAPRNDLAVLKLHRDVDLTDWIYPICTPQYGDFFIEEDIPAQVAGWGLTYNSYESLSDSLRVASVQIIEQCQVPTIVR